MKKIYNRRISDKMLITKILSLIILFIQLLLIGNQQYILSQADLLKIRNEDMTPIIQSNIINEILREEIRINLRAINDRWNNYIGSNPERLLALDEQGNTIYTSVSSGETISPDENTIYKYININDNTLLIKERCTGKTLMNDARPSWNYNELNDVINTVVLPIKIFGNTNSIMIFDSTTHEIIYSNKLNKLHNYNPDLSHISNDSNFLTVEDLYNSFPKTNMEENNKSLKMLLSNTNSDTFLNMTISVADNIKFDNINNFEKYPLLQYNREFQEKIILPYDTFGFDNEPMQLTLVVGVNEQNLSSILDKLLTARDQIVLIYQNLIHEYTSLPYVNVFLLVSLIVIMFYDIKRETWRFNNKKNTSEDSHILDEKEKSDDLKKDE